MAWERVEFWHELMSADPQRAETFYADVVGLTTVPLEGAPFAYTIWLRGDEPIGGLVPPRDDEPGWPSGPTPHWVVSFSVADVERAAKRTEELGGAVVVPPVDIPRFGRAAVLRDPDGAVFGVFGGSE
ncbi:MAG: VOC family protein [Thermoleophilia bacterium]|nr:VOC family protein [Thermoleophilia bacterium]